MRPGKTGTGMSAFTGAPRARIPRRQLTGAVTWLAALLVFFAAAATQTRAAGPQDHAILDLYKRFSSAQNAHDVAAVREMLSDRPDFLWISDGKPFWGRDAMIARMAEFQKAEIWRVEPEYESARVVMTSEAGGYLHIPLVLVLGSNSQPARLKWLVGVLCVRERGEWKIAALFTTQDKRRP
jgi:Domain of unknown function (DUF4440)